MTIKQASEFRRGERVKKSEPGCLDRTGTVFGTNSTMVFVEFHGKSIKSKYSIDLHGGVELCHPDDLEKY